MEEDVVASTASRLAEGPLQGEPVESTSADGDRSLETLVRQHLAHVYRVLRQLGVPESDVDDATQQVFLTLSRRFSEVRLGSERAFLSATAVRIASRWRRTHRRRREDEDAEPLSQRPAVEPSPELQLERAEAEQLLLRVLDALPEKLREVFVLFEIEEMTLREISEALALPAGTAASRLRLAREGFRRAIATLGLSAATRSDQ
jgi:RNA polymerase sigma-70 factor (ECF subfamily)